MIHTKTSIVLATILMVASTTISTAASYELEYKELKKDILAALPKVDGSKQKAYDDARAERAAAEKELKSLQSVLGQIGKAKGLVGHAKDKWIAGANKGIKQAQAQLKNAKSDEEKKAAEANLARWEKDLEAGNKALAERQKKLDALQAGHENINDALKAAKEKVASADKKIAQVAESSGLASFLASDTLDKKLAKFVVLHESNPEKLEDYASKGSSEKRRIEKMLEDDALLMQMLLADGAAGGNYPRAMEIYEEIQNASENAHEGPLQRLALAHALVHAKGVTQRNIKTDTEAPRYVNPLERYLQFEKAYLANELDPAFKLLTTWDMRWIVDGEEPPAISEWGREMMRTYRPDHITTSDYKWRYVGLVLSEVPYGSQDVKYDRDDLHFFQNILKNGGVCGRRAFIGRFVLRSFGIPTIARPQKAHAALAHWTPDGWVINLGGKWGVGWTKTAYGDDLNFLATTQARAQGDDFMQVKRAQWIGDAMGEKRVYGLHTRDQKPVQPGFWNATAMNIQKSLIANAKTLAPVGEEFGEADKLDTDFAVHTTPVTAEDREITINEKGLIRIPAAATSEPKGSTRGIKFLPSTLGGMQLVFSRGAKDSFLYTFKSPIEGKFLLTAKVASPSWKQNLVLSINGQENAATIPLPHTTGLWGETEPIEIDVVKGKNEIRFSHQTSVKPKGFAIHDFTLKPVNNVAAHTSRLR